MAAIVVIVCGYSAYGIIAVALNSKPIHLIGEVWSRGLVTSTFINRNHFGTYAGIGLVAACGQILALYRGDLTTRGGSLGFRIGSIIEASGQQGALLIGAASSSLSPCSAVARVGRSWQPASVYSFFPF